jgi:small subunit ribosomal protein S6
MIVMRPDMTDEQRDMELAKFEAFLKKNEAQDVKVTVRGRQRLAYPIKRFGEGIYVLYTYAANPNVSQAVQKNLSTPEAGSELNILRHMTLRI